LNVPILPAAKSIPKPAAKTAKPAISANRYPNVAGTVFGKVGKYNQYLKVYQIPYGKLFGVRFSDDPPTHGNTSQFPILKIVSNLGKRCKQTQKSHIKLYILLYFKQNISFNNSIVLNSTG